MLLSELSKNTFMADIPFGITTSAFFGASFLHELRPNINRAASNAVYSIALCIVVLLRKTTIAYRVHQLTFPIR